MIKDSTLPPFPSLIEMLKYRAEVQPNKTLYTYLTDGEQQEEVMTYRGLEEKARCIGAHLQSLKASGSRALLLYPPGLEYIAAFMGCLYGNVVAVPAYPPDPGRLARTLPRLQAIIQDSEAHIVLTTEAIRSMGEFLFSQAPELASLNWIATDSLDLKGSQTWQDPHLTPKTLAFLQYTSGSTGRPKGVMLSHGNLLHNLKLIQEAFGLHAQSRPMTWLPPYHDMGLIGGLLEPIHLGCSTTLMSPIAFLQKPFRWLQALSRYRITGTGGPNFAYELCVRKVTKEQLKTLNLSPLVLAFSGAEPIRPETMARFTQTFAPCGFREEAFYPCYGLAEGTLIVSGGQQGEKPILKKILKNELKKHQVVEAGPGEFQTWVSCGHTLSDQDLKIVDSETLEPCAPDQVGEIWLKGPSVAQGYWNQPEETQKTLKAHLKPSGEGPFLRTGDLGFMENGQLFVTGRLKDLIIINGQNHYPQDIEGSVEKAHPSLRPGCGAVFSVEEEGEEALVVMQEIEKADEDFNSILAAIRQAVATHHELKIRALVLLPKGNIPKTSSGKISRYACRESFLNGSGEPLFLWKKSSKTSSPEGVASPPASQEKESSISGDKQNVGTIRDWLVQQLSSRLGLNPTEIDILKPITTYGLDSKDAINLSGELEDWLGKTLSPSLIWKYPTIAQLALHLSGEGELT